MQRTLIVAALVWCVASAAAAQTVVGDWLGTLSAGSQELHLALHIAPGSKGALTATLDSLDQGANGIPATSIVFEHSRLSLRFELINGAYEGALNADGTEIDGTWSQGQPMHLAFKRAAAPKTTRFGAAGHSHSFVRWIDVADAGSHDTPGLFLALRPSKPSNRDPTSRCLGPVHTTEVVAPGANFYEF